MGLRGFLKELHHRNVFKVAVAYTAAAAVLLEVLTHLFHNFEAPQWVLKVITTLLILGLPAACLMAWGFEFTPKGVRSIPRVPKETKPALPAPEPLVPPSIAVLPFADMSAEHDQQYLGDGIAEELLNALASIEGLNVAARTSSFAFAGKGASMTEIGDTLHVRHVLEGSVRRAGQKLRVTAQLIDVNSGFHLFTQSYDRQVQDIFDIQNDIAHEIAAALLPKLGISRDVMLIQQGTTNLEAYNLRLRARAWVTDPGPDTADAAIEQLKRALALDPKYADAWGDLAYVHCYLTSWTAYPVPSLMKAYHEASVALALSPTNVLALIAQAVLNMLVDHDAVAAADCYRQARAAGGDLSVWAYLKAYCYDGPLGRFADAIATLKDAEARDPLAVNLKWALIEMYRASGRSADAIAVAEELQRLGCRSPDGIVVMGLAFAAVGDVARAAALLAELRTKFGDDWWQVASLQCPVDVATGDQVHARTLLDKMARQWADNLPLSAVSIGEGYFALGDFEQAITWWSRAAERHEAYALSVVPTRYRTHPIIGKDPRFLALLKRMGLEGHGQQER
jgi:TolB-like protein